MKLSKAEEAALLAFVRAADATSVVLTIEPTGIGPNVSVCRARARKGKKLRWRAEKGSFPTDITDYSSW